MADQRGKHLCSLLPPGVALEPFALFPGPVRVCVVHTGRGFTWLQVVFRGYFRVRFSRRTTPSKVVPD